MDKFEADKLKEDLEKVTRFPVKTEWKFHTSRRWRFDFAIPELKIAIEIEGGLWVQGRHNRAAGYIKDMEKYNAAGKLGWLVLRYTPQQKEQLLVEVKNWISGQEGGQS